MRQEAIALVLILLVAGVVLAKDKAPFWNYPLTDELVEAAVADGAENRGTGLHMSDSLSSFGAFDGTGTTGFSVDVYSPYSWIAQQSAWAAKQYRQFDIAELEGEPMDVLRVYANPDVPRNFLDTVGATGVEHVVIRSTAKKFKVIQPLEIFGDLEYAQNAFGAEMAFASQSATFDMAEVMRISASDKKGEFFVLIIGDSGEEKKFKVKTKHFKRLP